MRQMKLGKEKLMMIMKMVPEVISEINDDNLRKSLQDMFNDESVFERFCSAPASHRVMFHNCMPSGLLDHTMRVYSIAKNLKSMIPSETINDDDIIVVSLLHDIGKLGDPDGENYYLDQDSTWHMDKLGEYYKINDNLNYMPHAQRSLFWCKYYNIPLTQDQYKAILIHDGQYVDENKAYAHKEGLLATILHTADILACNIERDKYNRFVSK